MKPSITLLVICLVVMGYLLSPPAALWAMKRYPTVYEQPAIEKISRILYAPTDYLFDTCGPYRDLVTIMSARLGMSGCF